jgi:hypothetical protein
MLRAGAVNQAWESTFPLGAFESVAARIVHARRVETR